MVNRLQGRALMRRDRLHVRAIRRVHRKHEPCHQGRPSPAGDRIRWTDDDNGCDQERAAQRNPGERTAALEVNVPLPELYIGREL